MDDRTFMVVIQTSQAIDDSPPRQVIRGQLEVHAVSGEDADPMKPHPSRQVGEHLVTALETHSKGGRGQKLLDGPLDLDESSVSGLSWTLGGLIRRPSSAFPHPFVSVASRTIKMTLPGGGLGQVNSCQRSVRHEDV